MSRLLPTAHPNPCTRAVLVTHTYSPYAHCSKSNENVHSGTNHRRSDAASLLLTPSWGHESISESRNKLTATPAQARHPATTTFEGVPRRSYKHPPCFSRKKSCMCALIHTRAACHGLSYSSSDRVKVGILPSRFSSFRQLQQLVPPTRVIPIQEPGSR